MDKDYANIKVGHIGLTSRGIVDFTTPHEILSSYNESGDNPIALTKVMTC